ncbi:MAG: hypothetical protein AB7O62_08720 [Pirellulales bacterium]
MIDAMESLFGLRGTRKVAALACDVAQRSCPSVWDRVNPRVLEMTSAEARGYIRVWATQTVTPWITAEALRSRGIRAAARTDIISQAAEGVVEKLLDEVLRIQRAARVRRRAA